MATPSKAQGNPATPELNATATLNEQAWQLWQSKGVEQEKRRTAVRVKIVKLAAVAVLLVTLALWARVVPYAMMIRFAITVGALVVMARAIHWGYYMVAGVFAVLAVLYNPVFPVFEFAGEWQLVVVAATIIPFMAALLWRSVKLATL